MNLKDITLTGINPALALLPRAMDSPEARVMLLAIGLQESKFIYRFQVVSGSPNAKGPARSFWQFEKGTKASRGGIWGVMLHETSRFWLADLCAKRGCEFTAEAIHLAIETDDVLAAGLARLLLFTDGQRLPRVDDESGAWALYAKRCWRPGKPHPETWPAYHRAAREYVAGEDL